TPFFFAGFNCIPQALGEADEKGLGRIGLIMVAVVVASLLFYALVIFAASGVVDRATLAASDFPMADAFEAAFGSNVAARFVLLLGMLGLITTWNAMFFASTRLIEAMSHKGELPSVFSRRSMRFNTPIPAICAAGLITAGTALMGRGFVEPIVSTVSGTVATMFVLVCAGVLKDSIWTNASLSRICLSALGLIFSALIIVVVISQQFLQADGPIPIEWMIIVFWLLLVAGLSTLSGRYVSRLG
ncbi:MAG: amino acid permease, partial [Pseudomonadota bacterium]